VELCAGRHPWPVIHTYLSEPGGWLSGSDRPLRWPTGKSSVGASALHRPGLHHRGSERAVAGRVESTGAAPRVLGLPAALGSPGAELFSLPPERTVARRVCLSSGSDLPTPIPLGASPSGAFLCGPAALVARQDRRVLAGRRANCTIVRPSDILGWAARGSVSLRKFVCGEGRIAIDEPYKANGTRTNFLRWLPRALPVPGCVPVLLGWWVWRRTDCLPCAHVRIGLRPCDAQPRYQSG
jgi:hypothetical protein